MITTKADKLLRSLIDAGLSLADFTLLATKVIRIQRDFKANNEDRRQRDRLREKTKLREQSNFEQQLKEEEQRRIQGLIKLRELGYITNDETYQIPNNNTTDNSNQSSINQLKTDQLLLPYSKQINDMKLKQRDCCLTFNIDYDLRLNQQILERACRRAKQNIYELRAERFNRPEYRSVLSVETATLHNKLKEAIREINRIFLDSKSNEDQRHLQELLTYINQFEGDIDLLMCQMQYEPKVKETILFSPVTTDILDRMNLILHSVRTLANQISTGDFKDENLQEEIPNDLLNIPTKVTYIIKIKTNDEISSSLSDETNVTIKLYGTYNKSPDIRLIQSINKTKWQSGQIDLFNIELNYLSDIYAIEIWHDSQYSSWKVDWIEIIDDAANIYRFPLDRLFDKYSEEKKTRFIIQRDIGPVNRLPTKPSKQIKPYKQIGFSTYTVQVKTGKQPNKVTDSSIFIQMKGENGNFSDHLCSANSAFKSSVFEPDQLDTFYLVWPYLAKINSLHLLVQSEGVQPSWFCEYITVEDGQTGDKYKFIVRQLFDGSNADDPNLKRHLTVYPEAINQKEDKEVKEKPGYLMKLKTGEKGLSNMSTLPSINIVLKGEKEKSEPYILKSLDNKRKLFQENQTDEFPIPSKYYIGPIKALKLSSNGQLDKWFIENIIIRDIAQGKDYIFPIYKWINTQDGTNNLTVQPINERKADYIVYTRTIASELKGPDRSIKLNIQGNKGKQEIELNNPITMYNTFQPGRKDEYYIENTKSLGDLQSIEIDITHPNIKKLGLDYIEIKDLTTNDSYRFNINRMLDSKNPKMVAKAERIPRAVINPTSSKLSPNQRSLPNSRSTMSNKQNFDQITKNTPQGAKRPDKESKISINVDDNLDKSSKDSFEKDNLNKSDTENKPISTLEIPVNTTKNNYKIKLKTINKEFLDKDTKLQLELIDQNGQSQLMVFNQTENNLQGKTDTFTIDAIKDFGKLKNIKLSLVGSKSNKRNLYQPEFIEIFHPNSNKTYRLEYTKDDFLNSDKNRMELTKSIKLLSDINIREKTQPQGAVSSTAISKSTVSPYPKLVDSILAETDDENLSLPNHTITSSISQNLSKEMNSSSEKSPNRQIRPGDRVKKNSKRQLIDHQSKPSLHEADWYRRSIETKKDYRDEAKEIQLISNKHISQTKFDQKQAYVIKNDEQKLNLLPKTSSSRSLKQEKTTKIISKLPSHNQQQLNSLSIEMSTVKTRTKSKISQENQIITKVDKILSAQQLSINQERQQRINDRSKQTTPLSSGSSHVSISDQKQTNDPRKMMVVIESPTPSNISELTKPSTTSYEQSKISIISSKTSDLPLQKEESYDRIPIESNSIATRSRVENSDTSFTNKQQTVTPSTPFKNEQKVISSKTNNPLSNQSISLPLKSQTPNDIPKRRSLSVSSSRKPSNTSSTISKDQSQQLINISSPSSISNQTSYMTNPSPTVSHLSQLTSKTTSSPISIKTSNETAKQKTFTRPQLNIIDSTFDEFDSQPNIQNISAVTIQTIATKSDSDINSTRKSIESHESEHSLQSNLLLSPDIAKKSRKNRRQNTSKTSKNTQNEQTSISQPLIISSDASTVNKLDNYHSSTNNQYLSKETSDIQYAPRPVSSKSQSNNIPSAVELKTSNTVNERTPDNQDTILKQYRSYTDEPLTQKISNIQSTTQSIFSQETNSKQTIFESHSKDKDISSIYTSKPSLNTSTTTGNLSISTTQSRTLPNEMSNIEYSITSKKQSTNSNLPTKRTEVDHMSTVYEESEPSTISIPNVVTSSFSKHDSNQGNLQDWLDTSSNLSSSQQNFPLNRPNIPLNNKLKKSSKEKSLSNIIPKSPNPSKHHKKTIDAKTKLPSIKSNTSIDYEFRVQTGNESQFDGTNEPISIELINTKGHSMIIPLKNSINNSKPFQKGQLDIFHLNIPNHFHVINKINLFLSQTTKDPIHIRYCELQDRQTMNTLYFPIEKWLGEKDAYNVEMYINNSLF